MQGYVIYSVRKKLKKQYMHLKGKQIEKLKKSGVEACIAPTVGITKSFYIWHWFDFEIFVLDYRHHIVSGGGLHG